MERITIGFFGDRNAGKSSFLNALTGQNISVVSDVKGTTTDPVRKAMELLPLGAVTLIDTPGMDDIGALGEKRVEKTMQILREIDLAVLVTTAGAPRTDTEQTLLAQLTEKKIPHIIVANKADLCPNATEGIPVCSLTGDGMEAFLAELVRLAPQQNRFLVRHLIPQGSTVVLVIPIDEAAPKDRIILPQQQVLRELLDHACTVLCCQPSEIAETLARLRTTPDLVICDSQAFRQVAEILPESVCLTSFSILFAAYKGNLADLTAGAKAMKHLQDGDRVLICEGCTHKRQCGDIGTVKIPRMIESYSGAKPDFTFVSGRDFPEDLSPYKLMVHCGGCMLTAADVKSRLHAAKAAGVPAVNYGVLLAEANGILSRSLEIFGH